MDMPNLFLKIFTFGFIALLGLKRFGVKIHFSEKAEDTSKANITDPLVVYDKIYKDKFDIIESDDCKYKGALSTYNNNFEYYTFISNNSYSITKKHYDIKRCYQIVRDDNPSLLKMDFCENFEKFNFNESIDCKNLQDLINTVTEYHSKIVFLPIGRIHNIDIMASMPRNPCDIYRVVSFMQDTIDKMSVLLKKQDSDHNMLVINMLSIIDGNKAANGDENFQRKDENKPTISGPLSLLYFMTQHIRCVCPKIVAENLKDDLDEIAKKNHNGCFTFDLDYKSIEKNRSILISFIRKIKVKYTINAPLGDVYRITSVYADKKLKFGQEYISELMQENKINENEPNCGFGENK